MTDTIMAPDTQKQIQTIYSHMRHHQNMIKSQHGMFSDAEVKELQQTKSNRELDDAMAEFYDQNDG